MSPRREPLRATELEPSPPATDDPPGEEPAELTRPMLTLTEAADASGRNRRTLRRYLDGGRFPNAAQDDEGTWRIPLEDLLAAGLQLHGTSPDTPPGVAVATPLGHTPGARPHGPVADPVAAQLAQELLEERAARQVAEARLEGAQALVAAHERQVATLTEALAAMQRALPPAPTERRRWWQTRKDPQP